MDIWIFRGGIYTGDGYMDMYRGGIYGYMIGRDIWIYDWKGYMNMYRKGICSEERLVDMYIERNWLICIEKPH